MGNSCAGPSAAAGAPPRAPPAPDGGATLPAGFEAPATFHLRVSDLRAYRLPRELNRLAVALAIGDESEPRFRTAELASEDLEVRWRECAADELQLSLGALAATPLSLTLSDRGAPLGSVQLPLRDVAEGPTRYDFRVGHKNARLTFQAVLEERREWAVALQRAEAAMAALEVRTPTLRSERELALPALQPAQAEMRLALACDDAVVRSGPGARRDGAVAWGAAELPVVTVPGAFRGLLQTMVHVTVAQARAPREPSAPPSPRPGSSARSLSWKDGGGESPASGESESGEEGKEEEDDDEEGHEELAECWLLVDKLYAADGAFCEPLYLHGVQVGTLEGLARLPPQPAVMQMVSGVATESGVQALLPLVVPRRSWAPGASELPAELRQLSKLAEQLASRSRQRAQQAALLDTARRLLELALTTTKPAVIGLDYADPAALWRARRLLLDVWARLLPLLQGVIFRLRVLLFDVVVAIMRREELNTPNALSLDDDDVEASFRGDHSGGSGSDLRQRTFSSPPEFKLQPPPPPAAATPAAATPPPRERRRPPSLSVSGQAEAEGPAVRAITRRQSLDSPRRAGAGAGVGAEPDAVQVPRRRRLSLSARAPSTAAQKDKKPKNRHSETAKAFALRYHELLHQTLAYVLPKLSGQTSEEDGRFCCAVVGVCALRLPEFGQALFGALLPADERQAARDGWAELPSTPQGQHVAVPEWRGFRLDEHVWQRRAKSFLLQARDAADPALLAVDWGAFHEGLARHGSPQLLRAHRRLLPRDELWTRWLLAGGGGDQIFQVCEAYVRMLIDRTAPMHDVQWELLPGYREVVKFALLELKARPPADYPEQLVQLTLTLQANRELVSPFVHIVLSRTSVHRLLDVSRALKLVGRWLARLGEWGDDALRAYGVASLARLNGRLPAQFDYSFFFAAVDVLLAAETMQTLMLAIAFLHTHWPALPPRAAEEARRRILQGHLGTLLPHWSSDVRGFFVTFLVWRLLGQDGHEPSAPMRAQYNAALESLGDDGGAAVLKRPVPQHQRVYVPAALQELADMREASFRGSPAEVPELWWEPVFAHEEDVASSS